jgi:hypothetical protein
MLVRLGTCQGSLSSICIIKKSIDQVSFKNVVFTLSNILINILMKMLWLFIQNIFCGFFLQLTVLWLFAIQSFCVFFVINTCLKFLNFINAAN